MSLFFYIYFLLYHIVRKRGKLFIFSFLVYRCACGKIAIPGHHKKGVVCNILPPRARNAPPRAPPRALSPIFPPPPEPLSHQNAQGGYGRFKHVKKSLRKSLKKSLRKSKRRA